MGIAPKKPAERVLFYVNKTAATGAWKLNASGIGSSTTTIDALNVLALAAQSALADQQAKRDAAETATQHAHQTVAAMSVAGSAVLSAIKAKADVAGDSIYTLADIPQPATPSPVAAPGTPTGFKVELVQGGALKLSWKCPQPANAKGTVYQIARQVGAGGTPVIIGAIGKRSFIDATLPAGAAAAEGGITYSVTAIRSTKAGLPGEWVVKLGPAAGGAGGAGEMTIVPKLAA